MSAQIIKNQLKNMKNKILLLMVLSLLCLPNWSIAVTSATSSQFKEMNETQRRELEQKKEAMMLEAKQKKEAMRAEAEQKRETIKNDLESRKESLKQEMEQRKETIKNSIEERRQNIADKIEVRTSQFVQNVIKRLNAAADRLDILMQRIESRIAKIKERNIDTSAAEELLSVAQSKISEAKTSIAAISFQPNTDSDSASASTTNDVIKEAFESTRVQIELAKQNLKEAHSALVDVIKNLKPGDNKLKKIEANNNASTTEETN